MFYGFAKKFCHAPIQTIYFDVYCFLNLRLSKALNWSQKSIVKFCHFLCFYRLPKIYVCVSVCLSVCLCVSCQFFVAHSSKEVAPLALKFCIVIYICFLMNPVDFGDDLPKIVVFRLYCRFCLIWAKFVFILISRDPM